MYVDNSATVDNVWVFQKGDDKVRRQPDGAYRAAWRIGNVPVGDQTTRIQSVLNNGEVYDLVFDKGTVIINGTLDVPAGKRIIFRGDGALSGTGTVEGDGTFECISSFHIFKSTLKVKIKPDTLEWNAKWFGAKGDGSTDDSPACQRWVDNGILAAYHHWFIPTGRYRLDKGILWRKDNGSGQPQFIVNATVRGAQKAYGSVSPVNCTIIEPAANTFGFGFHCVKGMVVTSIGGVGKNEQCAALAGNPHLFLEDPAAVYVTSGVRDVPYSPHAIFVIDPIAEDDTTEPNRYPGFESYYVATSVGGSTDVVISNCFASNAVVGFALSPHNTPQNADHCLIQDCWAYGNKVGWSLGQSQNRTINIDRCACWGATETIFDTRRYGDGTGGMPEVTRFNAAGGNKFLCRIAAFDQNNGIMFRDCHLELMYSFGGSFTDGGSDYSGHLKIYNSWIHMYGPYEEVRGAKTIFKGRFLTLEGCRMYNVNNERNRWYNIDALNVFMSDSNTEYPYTVGTTVSQDNACEYQNVGIGLFQNQRVSHSGFKWTQFERGPESSDKSFYVLSDLYYTENTPLVERVCRRKPRAKLGGWKSQCPGVYVTYIGPLQFASINLTTKTATINFPANSDAVKSLYTDLPLMMSGPNEYGDTVYFDSCHVDTVNIGTGVVTVKHLSKNVSGEFTTGTNYTFYVMRPPMFYPNLVIGDITTGSDTVTNVNTTGNGEFYPTIGLYPKFVDSPFFPPMTRILSYNAVTKQMVLSHAATATKTNVSIHDIDVKKEMLFGSDPVTAGIDSLGWQRGDVVYNDYSNPANDDIMRWECIKPGMSGAPQNGGNSTKVSEWKAVKSTEIGGQLGVPASFAVVAKRADIARLTWAARTGATNYTIERSPAGGGSWSALATLAQNIVEYEDTTASPATAYDYRIRANGDGVIYTTSNWGTVNITMPALIAAPTWVDPTAGGDVTLGSNGAFDATANAENLGARSDKKLTGSDFFIEMQLKTPASGSELVEIDIFNVNNTNYLNNNSGNDGLVAGMVIYQADYYVRPAGSTATDAGTPKVSDIAADGLWVRMRASGNDLIFDYGDGTTYTTAHTITDALVGVTDKFVKIRSLGLAGGVAQVRAKGLTII